MTGQRQIEERYQGERSREERDEQAAQQSPAQGDAQAERLSQHKVAEFHSVAVAMQAILDGASVDSIAQAMTPAQRAALEHLYTARNARDAETGGYVSAAARKNKLDQALRCLQPVLALARRPDFRGGQPIFQTLAAQISGVRKEIGSAIQAQLLPMGRPAKKVEESEDGPDEPGESGEPSGNDPETQGEGQDRAPDSHRG